MLKSKFFRIGFSLLATTGLALFFLSQVFGAGSESTGQATARVVAPLKVLKTVPLDFGAVLPGDSEGRVTVTPTNTRVVAGGVEVSGEKFSPALFHVSGEPGVSYGIRVRGRKAVHDRGGNQVLEVVDWQSASANIRGAGSLGRIGPDGTDRVSVGGTLVVPPEAKPGGYKAEVEVMVTY